MFAHFRLPCRFPFLVLLLLLSSALGGSALAGSTQSLGDGREAATGQLLVRFAPSVSRSAVALVAQGRSFRELTGSDALDRLNARFGLRDAQSLVLEREGLEGQQASQASREHFDAARQRFPERALRAPADLEAPDFSNVYLLTLNPKTDLLAAARAYSALPEVIYAEPDWVISLDLLPDDPYFSSSGTWGQSYGDLWGPAQVEAPTAWDTATGVGVTIAIVDSGIDSTHEDLAGQLWVNAGEIADNGIDDDLNGHIDDVGGWDFLENDSSPEDTNGHGTHVAGTAVAVGNNGVGIVGVAFGARAMAIRAFASDGTAVTSDLVSSLMYAGDNGADIINASWSGTPSQALTDAIAAVRALGVVVVVAAGNDASSTADVAPANEPGVITVGATGTLDNAAIFTNFGDEVNLAAPGVDILSAKSVKSVSIGGVTVAGEYLRLSGTSMAAPHVAGAAAILMDAFPTLTANEVAWHLELNANQVEHPGYEGLDFNPYLGWGRLDIPAAFTTPPVVTRLTDRLGARHAFVDAIVTDTDRVSFLFTTEATVGWTLTTPSWLVPDVAVGSDAATVALSLDATGESVGLLAASLTIDAPSTDDGGDTTSASWWLHDDPRLIAPFVVPASLAADGPRPGVASNGLGTMVVWQDASLGSALRCLEIDNNGAISAPVSLTAGPFLGRRLQLAASERDYFLFTEQESETGVDFGILRIGPGCVAIDSAPFVFRSRKSKANTVFEVADIEYDGDSFALLWRQTKVAGQSKEKYVTLRVSSDGIIQGKRRNLYPTGGLSSAIGAELACLEGSCLFFWDAQSGPQGGISRPYDLLSFELVGSAFVRRNAKDALDGLVRWEQLAAGDGDYLAVGKQFEHCVVGLGLEYCRQNAVGARITADGDDIDFFPIVLNQGSEFEIETEREAVSAAWDGTNFNVLFRTTVDSEVEYIFAQQIDGTGTTLGTENEGSLVFSGAAPITQVPEIVSDARHSVVVTSSLSRAAFKVDPNALRSLSLTTLFAKPAPASFVEAEVGAIGDLVVDEGATIERAFLATGLNPATTVFSVTGLPEGAILESSTGLFRLTPGGADAGVYPSVHVEAFDGTTTVFEDLTLTVNEVILSVSGVVQNALDSSPAAGVALRLVGVRGWRPTAFTDAQGRFRFEGVEPNDGYRVQLDNPTRRTHSSEPRSVSIELLESDAVLDPLLLSPRD